MYSGLSSEVPFLYGAEPCVYYYIVPVIHLSLHFRRIFGMRSCDIASVIFIFTCYFIFQQVVAFWVHVFFIAAIVTDFSDFFFLLFLFLLFSFFIFYDLIHIFFILLLLIWWKITVSYVVWVHSNSISWS